MMGSAVIAGSTAITHTSSAEVTIVKNDSWEVYVAGRINAFVTYAFGDAYPVALAPMGKIVPGGGVENGKNNRDLEPVIDPVTGMRDPTQQGTLSSMRVRNGALPNILTLGTRKSLGGGTTLKAQVSIWGTIESPTVTNALAGPGQFPREGGRSGRLRADFQEAFLTVEGSWGSVTGGRFMSLFSRGTTEMAYLYGHRYGVGFPLSDASSYQSGSLSEVGPTGGMIGLGVLAANRAAGIAYATPSLSGIKLTAGVFDGVKLGGDGGYQTTRTLRPEAELTYDFSSPSFNTHVFANGGFQNVHVQQTDLKATMWGAGYGGRFEFGPVHIGAAGHYGKGVGLTYAFDGTATSSSTARPPPPLPPLPPPPDRENPLRSMSGFVGFVQVVAGQFDLNVAVGQTQIKRVPEDNFVTDSVIKTQTGISAGVVYHISDNFHLDLDFINTSFAWSGGEKQKVNFVNSGVTMTF